MGYVNSDINRYQQISTAIDYIGVSIRIDYITLRDLNSIGVYAANLAQIHDVLQGAPPASKRLHGSQLPSSAAAVDFFMREGSAQCPMHPQSPPQVRCQSGFLLLQP